MLKFFFGMSDETKKHLVTVEKKIDNTEVVLKVASKYMEKSVDDNFRAGGRPKKWAPLTPLTKQLRRNKNFAAILQDTTRLKTSITSRVFKDHAVVGTNVEYARLHQEGGMSRPTVVKKGNRTFKIGANPVPKREFLLFQKEDIVAIDKFFMRHVKKAIG